MYKLHQGTPPILQIHCSKPHTIYGCYFTEEKCIKPTVKVRRELTPEHTGNLLSLEKSLLSQLLDLLAACKKSKQVVSTTTRVATTIPTTVLVDATTTPGELAYKCIIYNSWQSVGQSSSVRVGDSGFFYFIWFHQTFTKMLPNFISIFWYKDVNDYRFIIHCGYL